jgi:Predicted nucleotide-binding protein containing TIR -like domain
MAYYHVFIETNNPGERYYELDKTDLSEIKEEVILPYMQGLNFVFDGYFFNQTQVKRIVIKESACTSEDYADREWMKSSPESRMYIYPENIVGKNEYTTDITRSIFKECKGLLKKATSKPKVPMDKSKVFIVHGHDDAAKEAAARFVENLGFKAIILHEQASSGNTIIEKIEANSNVGFAIVLYTPCDEGRPKGEENQLKPRARQNVIFEHGYLIGKIGRKNVSALVKGDVETPNDISGVVYIKMDEADSWKYAVGKEMKACGYDVDLNKI